MPFTRYSDLDENTDNTHINISDAFSYLHKTFISPRPLIQSSITPSMLFFLKVRQMKGQHRHTASNPGLSYLNSRADRSGSTIYNSYRLYSSEVYASLYAEAFNTGLTLNPATYHLFGNIAHNLFATLQGLNTHSITLKIRYWFNKKEQTERLH